MAQEKRLKFHRRATMALDGFSAQDQARIEDAAGRLVDPASRAWIRSRSARAATSEPLYLLRATPTIRLIYRKKADGVEILDVVEKAKLQAFVKMAAGSSGAARTAAAASARSAVSEKRVVTEGAPAGSARRTRSHAKKPVGTA